MALIDVVKFTGGDQEFVWKFPSENLRWGTQLVVKPAQAAFFVRGGRILDQFEPGTYTLESKNLPLLTQLFSLPFGGDTPFQAEVWFVNMVSKLDTKWGTATPIQLEDPRYGVIVPVRAFGQFGFRVAEPRVFFETLNGTAKVFTSDKIVEYFKGRILVSISTRIGRAMAIHNVSVLQIAAMLEDLSRLCEEQIRSEFLKYGLEILNFYIQSINVPDNDPSLQRLKEIKEKAALLNVVGKDIYQLDRSMDVLQTAAANEGSVGGMMGAGIGLGMGLGVGGGMGRQMASLSEGMNTQITNPPIVPPPVPAGFLVLIDGIQQGPLTLDQIRVATGEGKIRPESMVWRQGMTNWLRADLVAELRSLFISPPLPPPPTLQFHVLVNNSQQGPYDLTGLRQLAAQGQLASTTLVWRPGMATWEPAASQVDLRALFTAPPPPPVVPPPPPN